MRVMRSVRSEASRRPQQHVGGAEVAVVERDGDQGGIDGHGVVHVEAGDHQAHLGPPATGRVELLAERLVGADLAHPAQDVEHVAIGEGGGRLNRWRSWPTPPPPPLHAHVLHQELQGQDLQATPST